ncbi:MYXO-CTERM sorting domain-containing protein [Aeromonas sp. A-5]
MAVQVAVVVAGPSVWWTLALALLGWQRRRG